MFKHIFLFELWYRFRRPATYVYFVVYLLVGILYGSIAAEGLGPESAVALTQGGKNLANSPYILHQLLLALGQIGIFAVAAIMGVPVYRDFQYNSHALFFTKPISKLEYLGGRFLGSLLITFLVLTSIAVGMIIAFNMPYANEAKLGAFNFSHYLKPYLLSVFPFAFFSGAIFFATVSLTRNQVFIYLNAIMILILFSVASALANEIDNKTWASLLDPTGGVAFTNVTEYWSIAEKNTQTLPANFAVMSNLLLWQAVGIGVLVFTYFKFSFSFQNAQPMARRSKRSTLKQISDTFVNYKVELPVVTREFSIRKNLNLLWVLIRREYLSIVKSPIFLVILGVGVLMFIIIQTVAVGASYSTKTYPVTYQIIDTVQGSFALFLLAIIIFYAGELVWKERSSGISPVYDALPMPNWLSYTSKLLAMFLVVYSIMALMIVCGIITQVSQGYFRIELGLYLQTLLFYRVINFLLFTTMIFFVQVLVNNKYVGFLVSVLVIALFTFFTGALGLEEKLLIFASGTSLSYSDMNGYGHFVHGFLSFKLYWAALAGILAILSHALWQRGPESHWKTRIARLKQQLKMPEKMALAGFALLFVGMGSYIYYNTHVLNDYVTSKDQQKLQAEYEKRFSKYNNIPQPKIISIALEVDLKPETRDAYNRGVYWLKNKHAQAIDSIHVNLNSDMVYHKLAWNREVETVLDDEETGYKIYALKEPLAPGDSIRFEFHCDMITRGFSNSGGFRRLLNNGTFLSNMGFYPMLGYQSVYELQSEDLRKKYELPKKASVPPIDDTLGIQRNLISNDADWIDFEATVSTSPDQIAIAPGYLQKSWEENGRKYFHYKMDSKMLNFYAIVSGRYEVAEDIWTSPNGDEIKLEVYHHAPHTYNVEGMMRAMKESLAYNHDAFSPYQHRQVRILEVPRSAGLGFGAQSFTNTIPYNESAGFIMKVEEGDIDMPYYITSHEVAHQWWAHQVVSGYVQGFQVMIEAMAQYSALMAMENVLGPETIKKYLRYELDGYLRGKSAERKKELPLYLSENQQYIHYQKGSLVMYALKSYLGEDTLNQSMRNYLHAVRYQEAPYTTSVEWKGYIEQHTPDSLKSVFKDLVEKITFYELKVNEATYEAQNDSLYALSFEVEGKKFYDDGTGEETETPLDNYVDVGIFGREKVDGKWQDQLIEMHQIKLGAEKEQVSLTLNQKPRKVVMDPYFKLIDRKPDDNTKRFTEKEKTEEVAETASIE